MLLKCSTGPGHQTTTENGSERVNNSSSTESASGSISGRSSSSSNASGTSSTTALFRGTGLRMTMATASTMTPRLHRKSFRIPSKRHPGKALPGKLHSMSRIGPGKIPPGKRIQQRPQPPPCDNSNDSGFGFDQHVEIQNGAQHITRTMPTLRSTLHDADHNDEIGTDDSDEMCNVAPLGITQSRCQYRAKRKKIESVVELDNDDACSQDAFISRIASAASANSPLPNTKCALNGVRTLARVGHKRQPAAALNNVATSSNGTVHLEIVSQPEQQHRARYQTEGSRGAVKDRSGNGFPIVRLVGYNKPALLQVFIGTDIGRVAPHMFYQACKVAGKNSTQCNEKKVDGTMIIEIDLKPESDMSVTCDCVGILKERNVDVEHRFPDHIAQKSKKKSTRCRMVFRTQLTFDDGTSESLQVCSNPIICTQPPGIPEICKRSLSSCPADGGIELFVIGKNFLKDTRIVFQESLETRSSNEIVSMSPLWEESVLPDKEYLQQTHLICVVPPYVNQNIHKPVTVQLSIVSSGKRSEPHLFTYTPKSGYGSIPGDTPLSTLHGSLSGQDARYMDTSVVRPCPTTGASNGSVVQQMWSEAKHEIDADMMPPPISTQMPMNVRRSSLTNVMITDQIAQMGGLKTEIVDENSQNSIVETIQSESLDQFPVVTNQTHMVPDPSPLKDVMQYQHMHKQNLDMLDIRSLSLLNDNNNMTNFPPHHNEMNVVAAAAQAAHAAEIAVKNEQIAKEILSVAVAQQGQQTVDKFLSSLSPTISDLKSSPQMEQNSLFVNGNGNGGGIIFPPQTSNNIVMGTNTAGDIDQTLNNILAVTNHSSTSDMQSLTLVRTSSVSSTSSSSSSSCPSTNGSPISHDIILNSEPAAALTSVSMQRMLSGNESNHSPDHITSEMILTTNVPPSTILCPSNPVQNLMVNQVPLLNGLGLSNRSSEETLLNTIIMGSPTNSSPIRQQSSPQAQKQIQQQTSPHQNQTSPQHQEQQVASTPQTVSSMIMKAAADFISNHENNPESTINALMALDTNPIQTDAQVSQILGTTVTTNSMVPTGQSSLCSTTQYLSNNRHHHILEPRRQEAVPLVNMLLNHDVQTNNNDANNAQSQFLQNLQKTNQLNLTVPPQTSQESIIQVVALAETALQKSAAEVAQQQINVILPSVSLPGPPNAVAMPTTATTIPQEITTMSDQDLISYINPSTFDQL